MEKVIIAAVSEKGVIGFKNNIPWHIPEDLKRFKQVTMGHALVMGRNTYQGLLQRKDKEGNVVGKPLPGRKNIVLSENSNISIEHSDVCLVRSIEEAFSEAEKYSFEKGLSRFYISGGEEVYRNTIPLADRLDITEVHGSFLGDKFFPDIDKTIWKEVSRKNYLHDGYAFVEYARK